METLGNPAIRIVHGSDRQVLETASPLIGVQQHIIGVSQGGALYSFVLSGLRLCIAHLSGRKAEDKRIVSPLELKIEET